jgi:hypothetical protein
MGETQEFRGRWGQPQPVMEFGKGWPQAAPQEFGRGWPEPVAQEFGKGFPQVAPQDFAAGRWGQPAPMQFGGKIPFIEQGGRVPRMPFPPGGSRYIH